MEQIEKSRVIEITTLHTEVRGLLEKSLVKAMRIGELLVEQKSSLRHGEFGNWMRANLPFTNRTARSYMNCYKNRHLLKTESVSDLAGAYKLLSPPTVNIAFENDVYYRTTMDIRDIEPNPFFSMEKLIPPAINHWVNCLTDKVRNLGLYWDTAVRRAGDSYQNICDHDRYYAIQKVGIKDVPVTVVKKMPDKSMKKTLELFDYRCYQEYREWLRIRESV